MSGRSFEGQIEYIVNHAEDEVIFTDLTFVAMLEKLQSRLPKVRHHVVLTAQQHMPEISLRGAVAYETLIQDEPDDFAWPSFPEHTPSSLCYTSGTTGDPKGVLYTHHSNFLHLYAANGKDVIGVDANDALLVAVPLFHANSWGLVYCCPMVGAHMILPGAKLDGGSIYQLFDSQQATSTAGVPTVWHMLLAHLKEHDLRLPYLKEVVIGGSAVPRGMLETFDKQYQVQVVQAWGMAEMSPIGTICRPKPFMKSLSCQQRVDILVKQDRPVIGVAMKIVDDEGNELSHDGRSCGRLLVKGPWVVKRYYKHDCDAVDTDGWFDTCDVATIDEHGYMQITDRAKDLIKSGGEWISSVDLENAAMDHPDVSLAAVVGVRHPKWDERPLLIVKPTGGAGPTKEEILGFLKKKVAKWWLPDDVIFVDDIPLTATGKISKLTLR